VADPFIVADGCGVRRDAVIAYFECDDDECHDVHVDLSTGSSMAMPVTWTEFDHLLRG
jgi:hypothetical protein